MMKKRKGIITNTLLFLVIASLLTFHSAYVEQWELLENFSEAYTKNPGGIFIVILAWFVLMVLVGYIGIKVTPWFGAMCLIIAFFVGLYFIAQSGVPEITPPEEARDSIVSYIKEKYPTSARLLENITWSDEDITPSGMVGKTIYQYLGGGWNVTISWAVVKDPIYEVNSEYSSSNNDLIIMWEGTIDQAGVVEEEIKSSYQSIESVRETLIEYIEENLPEASINISNQVWTLAPQEPMIGWVEYTYLSNEWNVTISYAVYLDVTYYVTVEKLSENIIWSGAIYDGIVIESDVINNQ